MKLLRLTLLILVLSLAGRASDSPELGVRNRLKELAGKAALDCGRAAKVAENSSKNLCATSAYKRKIPFFVQYSVIGTDALVEEGLSLDSQGRLFHVWAISKSPLYRGMPSGKIEVHLCDAMSLRKLDDAELTCSFTPQ
jgi:hypothetical protein